MVYLADLKEANARSSLLGFKYIKSNLITLFINKATKPLYDCPTHMCGSKRVCVDAHTFHICVVGQLMFLCWEHAHCALPAQRMNCWRQLLVRAKDWKLAGPASDHMNCNLSHMIADPSQPLDVPNNLKGFQEGVKTWVRIMRVLREWSLLFTKEKRYFAVINSNHKYVFDNHFCFTVASWPVIGYFRLLSITAVSTVIT